jgi:glycerol uptake facilitator-like aquaporin
MLKALVRWMRMAAERRSREIVALLESERAQGTVEYVGLILLVSMLMVALVAAMKGFHTNEGRDLAQLIVEKIKAAVNALTFR